MDNDDTIRLLTELKTILAELAKKADKLEEGKDMQDKRIQDLSNRVTILETKLEQKGESFSKWISILAIVSAVAGVIISLVK